MYEDLDRDEFRRIELVDPDGTVYNVIWASLNFCTDILVGQPEFVYHAAGSWRVENYVPPAPPEPPEVG